MSLVDPKEFDPDLLQACVDFAIESHREHTGRDISQITADGPVEMWLQASWASIVLPPGDFATPEDAEAAIPQCSSSFCICGKAAQLSGLLQIEPVLTEDPWTPNTYYRLNEKLVNLDKIFTEEEISLLKGDSCSTDMSAELWQELGRRLFGITLIEARRLFASSNSIYTVCYYANEIASKRGVTLNIPEHLLHPVL